MTFALGAGSLFKPSDDRDDEYTTTVVSKAIDTYIALANDSEAPHSDDKTFRAGLAAIVEQMFDQCIKEGQYKQAVGIAIESHRIDIIKRVFDASRDVRVLTYIQDTAMGVVQRIDFRNELLNTLVELYKSLPSPDYFSIAQCFVYLSAPERATQLLVDLTQKAFNPDSAQLNNTRDDPLLIVYQVAFDLAQSATQEFLQSIRAALKTHVKDEPAEATSATPAANVDAEGDTAIPEETQTPTVAQTKPTPSHVFERIRVILKGEESIQLYLTFLKTKNKTDPLILKGIKDALDGRNSVYHTAMSFANAFMNAGTASDDFLRNNLDWLIKASNWSKFTATAALGVLNQGNLKDGIEILRPYLPRNASFNASVYQEGGSLYALGLIHANHGSEVLELLKDNLRTSSEAVVQHGAALGLGAAGMATGNEEVYEELRNVLLTDNAVAGEACGYAMGLVMLGTANESKVEEMLEYARETSHQKITRGLAIGTAMFYYGTQEAAEKVISQLLDDKDAIMRYGGIYTIALAYAGTGNNSAIRRLLHVAVSDVSDDVRRASVTALGFLLFRNPTQVPRIVELLSESFNPHVRYGATLALGISCAGTGLAEAVTLLEPMTKDPIDFVRQGACIALSMILIQQNDQLNPAVAGARKTFSKIMTDKHEEAMAKFGAALASGILDAGGRNMTISLQSRGGSNNMPAIVSMALFTQFWHWFPMAHFASLAFTPTPLIGLTRDLLVPDFEFISNARPSLFAYPPPTKVPVQKRAQKLETAVLSTTAKAQARQRTKDKARRLEEGGADDMDVDEVAPEGAGADEGADKKEDGQGRKKRKPEPAFEILHNYTRVTPAQAKFVSFPSEGRFAPIRSLASEENDVYDISSILANRRLLDIGETPTASGRATPRPGSNAGEKDKKDDRKPNTTPGEEARAILGARAVTSGGGIVLLIDRKPSEPLNELHLNQDSGDARPGQPAPDSGEASGSGQAENTDVQDMLNDSEISPEDALAIARAMEMDEEGDDPDERMGVDQPDKKDKDQDPPPPPPGQGDGAAR